MSISELYQTLYAVLEAMDRILEFWLSASFALVVAAFLAADRLERRMYIILAVAYVTLSINMAQRFWINAAKFSEIRDELAARGENYNVSLSATTGITQLGVFVLGISGTLYFVWRTYKSNERG